MAVCNPHVSIGLARVVNVVRAVSATTAVYAPTIVNLTDPQSASVGAAVGLGIRNLLTCIFRDFVSTLEIIKREAAFAFDV